MPHPRISALDGFSLAFAIVSPTRRKAEASLDAAREDAQSSEHVSSNSELRRFGSIMQLVESEAEKARVCQVINGLAKGTMRGSLTVHGWLPLDSVSYIVLTKLQQSAVANCFISARCHSYSTIDPDNLTIEHSILDDMLSQGGVFIGATEAWGKGNLLAEGDTGLFG